MNEKLKFLTRENHRPRAAAPRITRAVVPVAKKLTTTAQLPCTPNTTSPSSASFSRRRTGRNHHRAGTPAGAGYGRSLYLRTSDSLFKPTLGALFIDLIPQSPRSSRRLCTCSSRRWTLLLASLHF